MMAQREPSFWFTAVSFRGRLRLAGRLPRADERPGSRGAWRSKASWYLATTDDRMIPPALQREMSERAGATCRDPGSHSIYVSQPRVVADVIERAASGVGRLREELR